MCVYLRVRERFKWIKKRRDDRVNQSSNICKQFFQQLVSKQYSIANIFPLFVQFKLRAKRYIGLLKELKI